jgi:hypothetical protein
MSASTAQAQTTPATSGSTPGQVVLNLGDPFTGLPCGGAYQANWNLSLDQVTRFAASQLNTCDLALTLAAIEGHVGSAYDQIVAAEGQNWTLWNVANGFLPDANDPAAEDRMVRVHAAQDRIQNARNGLRFLAKLSALLQYPPPPPRPATLPEGQGVTELLGQPPSQPASSSDAGAATPPQAANQGYDPGAIDATPLAPAPGAAPVQPDQARVQPVAPVDAGTAAADEAADDTRTRIACVTGTSWEVAASPAQNRDAMVIDDPVAGQALTWLASYAASGDGNGLLHSFAACPGAVASSQAAAQTPMPGAAQGLVMPPEPAPQPTAAPPLEAVPDQAPDATYPTGQPSQVLPNEAPTGQQGGQAVPPGGEQD